MPGQVFERDIVHAFNDYFGSYDIRALAYRHFQMRYQPQLFDVLVDSADPAYYLAIECKSVDSTTVPGLYFKKHFSWQGGVCQVTRESAWLRSTGRTGLLAVEVRRPNRCPSAAYFVPWSVVTHHFDSGHPGIPADSILCCPFVERHGGKYTIEHYPNTPPSNPHNAPVGPLPAR